MRINKLFFIFIVVCFTTNCTQNEIRTKQNKAIKKLPYYNDATFTPHWISIGKMPTPNFHQIMPFELLNQEGDTIAQRTFDGKIYVADFFFTSCPGICPKMTVNMTMLQDEFINDTTVLLLSHSVTPTTDSVATLKSYATANGVQSNKWHLATGNRELIYKLGRKAYFVEEDLGIKKTIEEFLHTENFVLIDQHKYIRGIYNGLSKVAISQLIEDIKTLKNE